VEVEYKKDLQEDIPAVHENSTETQALDDHDLTPFFENGTNDDADADADFDADCEMPSFLENDERKELNGVPDNYIGTTGTEVSITKAIKANKDADNGGRNVKANFSVNNATETDNVATTGAELLAMLVSAKTEEQNGEPNHITRTGRNRGKLSIKPSVSILFVALLHILIAHKTIHIHAKSKSYTQDKNKSVYEVKKRDFSFWVCKFALHKKCSCDYAVCPPCYNDALKKLSKNDVVH
ncbi:hypothetical protein ACHAXS_010704, partial [Conticribra weissflogii]